MPCSVGPRGIVSVVVGVGGGSSVAGGTVGARAGAVVIVDQRPPVRELALEKIDSDLPLCAQHTYQKSLAFSNY